MLSRQTCNSTPAQIQTRIGTRPRWKSAKEFTSTPDLKGALVVQNIPQKIWQGFFILSLQKHLSQGVITSVSEVFYTLSQNMKITFGANVSARLTIGGGGQRLGVGV